MVYRANEVFRFINMEHTMFPSYQWMPITDWATKAIRPYTPEPLIDDACEPGWHRGSRGWQRLAVYSQSRTHIAVEIERVFDGVS
jgi:hypothetical protein